LILPLLIPLIFACLALSPTAQAITDATAEDTHNKYKNVGTLIVIRGPNPIGLPPGIAAALTAVLIHERVLLSAGHFVARGYNNGNGVPFFSTVFVSFSPDNALDPSTWIPVPSAASAWVPHPSFPMPCSPQYCPFNDTDALAKADMPREKLIAQGGKSKIWRFPHYAVEVRPTLSCAFER
jgi:hypothetical protein